MEFFVGKRNMAIAKVTRVAFLLLLTMQVYQVAGLRCYECSTAYNQDCGMSPPPMKYLKPCPIPLCGKLYSEEDGGTRVERFCGGTDFPNGCRDTSYPDRPAIGSRYYRAINCRCSDYDGCNSGFSNIMQKANTFVPLVVLPILRRVVIF